VTKSTDSALSIAAQEFLWANTEVPQAHDYLIPPTVKTLRELSAHTVLDIGCGNGSFSALLHSQGFAVAGCDASASGLALARQANPGVDFFEHDILNPLPVGHTGPYDSVVSLEVIEHLLLPRQLVTSAYKALRPGGALIVSTPYHGYWKNLALALTNHFDEHWHPLRDFGHVKFFSRNTLLGLVREAGFSIRDFIRVGRLPAFACSMIVVAIKPE
jgi:2-polyprenyl-3-methyl-5-hydroxy-6-metoxy-1,4-benzoquinol methylase